ncbi:MAG TPA: response regulator [Polyangiaceae bacterium]|nr:response regulator [Polyangiaceae bacterium]
MSASALAFDASMNWRPELLLVDDEALNLSALAACLEPLEASISTAEDGHTAVRRFEESEPDLVILDLAMPGLDGIEVLRRIRSHATRYDTPVILLTGHAEREHRLRGLEAGADDYLEKPLDARVLLARANTLLRLKQSRDLLLIRNAELERAQREQRELTEFIVHDLKGPLTGIVANTEWVYEQLQRKELALLRALEDVLGSAGRLRSMINDLIAVSQLERGTFPVKPRKVQVGPILRSVTNGFARAAENRKIALVESPENAAFVQVDPSLIQRVLENILDNSLRYTPESGRVFIGAEVQNEIQIVVANSGPAIPEAERKLIFEKFTRGSNAGVRTTGNAGLGLYFCKRAIEAHGGDIEVIQTDEYPTCFVIRLPQQQAS